MKLTFKSLKLHIASLNFTLVAANQIECKLLSTSKQSKKKSTPAKLNSHNGVDPNKERIQTQAKSSDLITE